jgi:hypothetical protein
MVWALLFTYMIDPFELDINKDIDDAIDIMEDKLGWI